MRSIITIFLLLNALISFAQEATHGMVVYERVINFNDNPKSTTFTLLITPSFSLFSENKIESEEEVQLKPSSDDEFDLSFDVKFNGSKYMVLTNFKDDSIQCQESLFKDGKQQTYVVRERIAKVKWVILKEYKDLNGVKVQKAIGDFRGRKYTVWFATEIPVRYGPWKLNGLPGLIVTATDAKNEVTFNAVSFKIPHSSNSELKEDFSFNRKFKRIELPEYVILKKQQVEEVKKMFSSKLPRGAKFELTDSKSNDIELVYEFEETSKN